MREDTWADPGSWDWISAFRQLPSAPLTSATLTCFKFYPGVGLKTRGLLLKTGRAAGPKFCGPHLDQQQLLIKVVDRRVLVRVAGAHVLLLGQADPRWYARVVQRPLEGPAKCEATGNADGSNRIQPGTGGLDVKRGNG